LTSALQLATPANLRGRIIGLQTLASGVFGLALAPTLVPSLTQYLFHDRNAVGRSIATVVTITLVIAIGLQTWARRPLRQAVDAQERLP
jgi:ABC-type Mn2+/Zn2+ transport system permease subunit